MKRYLLQQESGSLLWGRHMAIKLRDDILRAMHPEVVLDFDGVIFTTRAFADELIKVKAFLQSKGIVMCFEHVPSSIAPMLRLVAA